MKKSLKGEAFLSLIIYLNSYPEQFTREASRFIELELEENFKEETGNNLSWIILFQSLLFVEEI
jgi:hypothetical protein